jgi:TnpA family transposase
MDQRSLQTRLLLCLHGMGTNTGLKRMNAAHSGISYRDLLYTRNRFINPDRLREAVRIVVNGTLHARQAEVWGDGTTACASDSKHFGAWDQNLMTKWHLRYGGPGIMVYWHVEKKSLCIYSQLKTTWSSEAASMIEGVLRHCSDMEVERQYVDSHGQSEVAFAFCRLLGFELLPRLKNIQSQRPYRPATGMGEAWPGLVPVLTRAIDWALIRQQYDQMVKYATALRLGTAQADAILRRFTRSNVQHPTYRALSELGKAVKTIFLCRYLHSEARNPRGAQCHRAVERRQWLHLLRPEGRFQQQPQGGSGGEHARAAPAAELPGVRQHADGAAGAGAAPLEREANCGGSTGAHAIDLGAREPLWHVYPRSGCPARLGLAQCPMLPPVSRLRVPPLAPLAPNAPGSSTAASPPNWDQTLTLC